MVNPNQLKRPELKYFGLGFVRLPFTRIIGYS